MSPLWFCLWPLPFITSRYCSAILRMPEMIATFNPRSFKLYSSNIANSEKHTLRTFVRSQLCYNYIIYIHKRIYTFVTNVFGEASECSYNRYDLAIKCVFCVSFKMGQFISSTTVDFKQSVTGWLSFRRNYFGNCLFQNTLFVALRFREILIILLLYF